MNLNLKLNENKFHPNPNASITFKPMLFYRMVEISLDIRTELELLVLAPSTFNMEPKIVPSN